MGVEEKKLYEKVIEGVKDFYNDKVRAAAKSALLEWSRSYQNFQELGKTDLVKRKVRGITRVSTQKLFER